MFAKRLSNWLIIFDETSPFPLWKKCSFSYNKIKHTLHPARNRSSGIAARGEAGPWVHSTQQNVTLLSADTGTRSLPAHGDNSMMQQPGRQTERGDEGGDRRGDARICSSSERLKPPTAESRRLHVECKQCESASGRGNNGSLLALLDQAGTRFPCWQVTKHKRIKYSYCRWISIFFLVLLLHF